MIKELRESLEHIKDLVINEYPEDFYKKDFEIIETELKKLEELKDIEEELGIDLITLFKALEKGFYFKKTENEDDEETSEHEILFASPSKYTVVNFWYNTIEIHIAPKFVIDCNKKIECEIPSIEDEVWIEDYGKTWALTKEELENDY